MAGSKVPYNATYLTPRVLYRKGITSADTGPADVDIPVIRMDVSLSVETRASDGSGVTVADSRLGYNHVLELYCLRSGTGDVVIDLYMFCNYVSADAEVPYNWVKVRSTTVTENSGITYADLPAGVYRAVVSTIAPGVTLNMVEQHSE
jgi:hypothetical protein